MRILITGATGFVGSSLLRALAAEEATLTGLARGTSDHALLADLPVRWLAGDVTDPASLRGKFTGIDTLIHAAGKLGQFGISPETYHRLHVMGTRHVLAEAAVSGVSRILYISSPGVLGPTAGAPQTEAAPYRPTNPYERSKAAAEQVARQFAAEGLPVIIVRPEFLYGPGDLHVLGLFRAVQSGRFFYINRGRSHCQPTFIGDGVRGMLLCVQNGRAGEIYHIAGECSVPNRELVETIAGALGKPPPRFSLPRPLARAGAICMEAVGHLTGRTPPLTKSAVDFFSTSYRFSCQKAQAELGYRPQVDLIEGVRRTVAWYREQNLL